jgi:phytoene dehydrogenase-like protein
MSDTHGQATDVVVIGGGLSGLAAATYLARAGRSVRLFEQARELGGRARTQRRGDFLFNLGPHAIYRGGRGVEVLRELGIPYTGRMPGTAGYAVDHGKLYTLPGGPLALLATKLLGPGAKLELARLLVTVSRIDPQSATGLTVEQWLAGHIRRASVRQLIETLFRVTSYTNAPDQLSADAAIAQLQMALVDNVLYLDGGWGTLVEGLERAARDAGVEIVAGAKVVEIEADRAVQAVRLADGATYAPGAVIVAGGPDEICSLLQPAQARGLRAWADRALPVAVACFDVALDRLPRPRALVAFGIDRPLYYSVHSAVAKLAPEGKALIHTAKYLRPGELADPAADERELEALLDLVQPGWRDVLIHRRFLPNMVVSNVLPTVAGGGLAGRPGPAVPGIANLFVCGDWVGREGMLSDAALASAKHAASLVIRAGGEQKAALPVRHVPEVYSHAT